MEDITQYRDNFLIYFYGIEKAFDEGNIGSVEALIKLEPIEDNLLHLLTLACYVANFELIDYLLKKGITGEDIMKKISYGGSEPKSVLDNVLLCSDNDNKIKVINILYNI